MSSPQFPSDQPTLASSLRVLRGVDKLKDLIEAFPTLERKALNSSPTLSEFERRQLLDFPNIEEETENIRQVSSRSREELLNFALLDCNSLSEDELELIKCSFWSTWSARETSAMFDGCLNRVQETSDRIFRSREAAYLQDEMRSIMAASAEEYRRQKKHRDDKQRDIGGLDPPTDSPWMLSLCRRLNEQDSMNTWGYIALFDAEAQDIDAERRDLFERRNQGIFSNTMTYNGAHRNLLDQTWKLLLFDAPSNVFVSTEKDADNSKLRQAFQELMDGPEEYLSIQDSGSQEAAARLKRRKGYLTNTFLVINKDCIDSVLSDSRRVDDMRILAFEADFPQPGRDYIEGYQGWVWVCLEQLIDSFYGERMSEDHRMDVVWEAAQGSKNHAFASLDEEEAKIWTGSTILIGPLPGSILSKRRMASQR